MSVEQIQALADGLATRLGRAVLVDDRDLRLVAASEDFGDADPARVWSLLHRRTRPEDVRHEEIARLGASHHLVPSAEPGRADLGLSLRDGHDRLLLHLTLRLHHMYGAPRRRRARREVRRPDRAHPRRPGDRRADRLPDRGVLDRPARGPRSRLPVGLPVLPGGPGAARRLIPRHVGKPRATVSPQQPGTWCMTSTNGGAWPTPRWTCVTWTRWPPRSGRKPRWCGPRPRRTRC